MSITFAPIYKKVYSSHSKHKKMITEIKNPRYKYAVKTVGFDYKFVNKEDAFRVAQSYKRLLKDAESFVFENYSSLLIRLYKSKVRSTETQREQELIENSIRQIMYFPNRDKERLIVLAVNCFCAIAKRHKIKHPALALRERLYSPFDYEFKSKHLITKKVI